MLMDGRYLDAEELGVLFKDMRMPMGQRELDDIVTRSTSNTAVMTGEDASVGSIDRATGVGPEPPSTRGRNA